ncbi:MAG: prepilin-type N-terminal cleavage/methylation domain-containing protein [Candidatus Acidiferrales bacterium]
MAQHGSHGTKSRRAKANGFSLIELLIVIAIILIIVAIAIPDLLRARIAANQADAVENCRTITSAQVIYYTMYGVGFAPTLGTLGGSPPSPPDSSGAQLIDVVLATGAKSGYVFTYAPLSPDPTGAYQDYSLNADPSSPKITGINHYFTDEPSVIHYNPNAKAGVNDPPIQ